MPPLCWQLFGCAHQRLKALVPPYGHLLILSFSLWPLSLVDVKDVGYVIVSFRVTFLWYVHITFQNYDFPNNCEDYIHRIGRTGVRHLILMLLQRR